MKIIPFVSKQKYELVFTVQNISYFFFSLQNEKYPVTEVSCNKGVVPGGKTAAFFIIHLAGFQIFNKYRPVIARRGLPAGSLPVRRKRDERRDRTAVFPRIRFHRTDRKLVCRTGAGTLLSKSWAADSEPQL
ncbi:MAG: hypothetical protein ACLTG8_14155 [Alistipes finegoldii]|uniref:hypothetical protein n=1 Tax=Alistipes finegoldii TaxID=214856 RepID=UPI00399434F5